MSMAAQLGKKKIRRKVRAAILGIGTACPPGVRQEKSVQLAMDLACQTTEQRAWLERVFMRSWIENRGTILAPDEERGLEALREFYPMPTSAEDRGPTTTTRMMRYEIEAPALAEKACVRALAEAGMKANEITHLVTVSCTGLFAPGLDAALIDRLGLAPNVQRLNVGFMGCHAAFNALAAARDAVVATPSAKVLMCCVELCSLHFAYGWDTGKMVANALFADGAAAIVLGQAPRLGEGKGTVWRVEDTTSYLMPDCREAMTWRIRDHGFEMTLAPEVPELVGRYLRPWCEGWLDKRGLAIGDIGRWAIHPGGPKVLSAVAESLGLPKETLRYSRAVLAEHGNMSSATVLFILQEMAKDDAAGWCVGIGLGPGLMAEGMLLER